MIDLKGHLALILFLLFSSAAALGQVTVKSGTSLVIQSGTVLTLDSGSDSLIIEDSTVVLNHGIISMGQFNSVSEAIGYPIKGDGYEIAIREFSGAANENIGGLGFTFSTTSNPGNVILKRGHSDILTSGNAVNRWFEFQTQFPVSYDIQFRYDSSELNGIDPALLTLNNTPAPASMWYNLGGLKSPGLVSSQGPVDSTGYFILSPYSIVNSTSNEDTICQSGPFEIDFIVDGIVNQGNQFVLEVSDVNGSFSNPLALDTLSGTTSGTFSPVFPSGLSAPATYSLRIRSTNISDTFALQDVYVRQAPVVSFTGLANEYCSNASSIILQPIPAGGIFSGPGITGNNEFHPSVAGAGSFNISYLLQDQWGCSGEYNQGVNVLQAPLPPVITQNLNTLTSDLNNGNLQWYFNGDSIAGANAQSYTPTQDGNYSVSITNAAGCTEISAPLSFIVDGLKGKAFTPGFSIYPNPGKGEYNLTLSSASSEEIQISVYSLQGALLFQEQLKQDRAEIKYLLDLRNFSSGSYYLVLQSDIQLFTTLIIKQ